MSPVTQWSYSENDWPSSSPSLSGPQPELHRALFFAEALGLPVSWFLPTPSLPTTTLEARRG